MLRVKVRFVVRCCVLVSFVLLGAHLHGDFDARLPISPAVPVDPNGPLPECVEDLGAVGRYGLDDFELFWDFTLGTPRYLRAIETTVRICDFESGSSTDPDERIVRGVETFIAENAKFFGVDVSQLGQATITRIGDGWLVVMRQCLTDENGQKCFVRGANVRFIVLDDCSFSSVKAFILRRPFPEVPAFCDPAQALDQITTEMGYTVVDLERQCVFTSPDPASVMAVWAVRVETGDGQMGEILIRADTCELAAEYRFQLHFPVSGRLLAVSPTTDPRDPNYLFATAEDVDERQPEPVAFARLESDTETATTREDGTFTIDVSGMSQLRWRIERPKTVPWTFQEHCTADPDVDAPLDVSLRLANALGCSDPCESVHAGEILPLDDGDHILPFRGLQQRERHALATAFMLFHHSRVFLDAYLERVQQFGLQSLGFFPVTLEVDPDNRAALYGPAFTNWTICLAPRLDTDDVFNGDEQLMVPTILGHEIGHHLQFDLTRALQGTLLDCFLGGVVAGLCTTRMEPVETIDNPVLSVLEAVADVIAADHMNEARFGYYDRGVTAGPLAYDISKPAQENMPRLEENHAHVANVLWEVRRRMHEAARLQPGVASREDFTHMLYLWVASNRVINGLDRSFVLSQVLFSELQDIRRVAFGCIEQRTQAYERAIVDGFEIADARLLPIRFIRGDSNQDGAADITDGLHMLRFQFLGDVRVYCFEALDVDDSDAIDVTDPIALLGHLFLGATPPPPPFEDCGFDNTGDVNDSLDCLGFGLGGCEIEEPCIKR